MRYKALKAVGIVLLGVFGMAGYSVGRVVASDLLWLHKVRAVQEVQGLRQRVIDLQQQVDKLTPPKDATPKVAP